jgi:hypothetical protein
MKSEDRDWTGSFFYEKLLLLTAFLVGMWNQGDGNRIDEQVDILIILDTISLLMS